MKKLSLALVAALSLSTAAFAEEPKSVPGSDGQIKFTGTITEAGCTIDPTSATIDLGSEPKAVLQNSFSGWRTGSIKFKNCNFGIKDEEKPIQSVEITINPGKKADFGDNLWANAGTATGVGIEVEIGGQDGIKKVTPAGVTEPIVAKIDGVNNTATYQVQGRMAGAATVTPGSVDATILFTASYK